MTAAKPTPGADLVEPLRQFLESFTQELTEQQFIPAFRGELGKLAEGLDNIQQSGETLQQIARGVDRLRDVFAPAGTRMLEGVKEIEAQMRSGGEQMRVRAEEVLTQLSSTHRELEQALRTEAGLLNDQSSTSRETLQRVSGQIDEQLKTFSSKLDALCRRAEEEIAQLGQITTRAAETQVAPQVVEVVQAPAQPNFAHNPEELMQLLSHTEATVSEELARHSSELREFLASNTRDHGDRLQKIDKTIEEALKTVAPKVQAELDTALARLRDQMDAIVRVEREVAQKQVSETEVHPAAPAVVDTSSFIQALSASENRMMREFDEMRKSGANELTEIQQGLATFALDLADVTEKQTERVEKEQQNVKDMLLKLERMSKERNNIISSLTKQSSETKQQVDALLRTHNSQLAAQISQQLESACDTIKSQHDRIGAFSETEEARFEQLKSMLSHVEEQAVKLIEQQNNETRAARERIEAGVNDLRGRWDGKFEHLVQKSEEISGKMAGEFQVNINSLKDEVEGSLSLLGEALRSDMARFDTLIREFSKHHESTTRELNSEVSRAANLIDEKLSGFESKNEENERFTRAVEGHVKVVASEVSALRSKQQEQLEVLKEAVRANYDDNAARLKEVIEGAYDKFLEQIRTIPQALERYSKFVEAMNQSNQLALQGITGNTENLLTLTHEMREDNEAQKKFFPILNKTLDKHSQVLEAVRRSQTDHDKSFSHVNKYATESREEMSKFLIDLKGELRRVEGAEQTKLTEIAQMHNTTYSELEKLQKNDLPAFRKEVIQLVQSKFEFIENTQAERVAALRAELSSRLDEQHKIGKRSATMIASLVALGVFVQLALHFRLFSFLMP
jgi:DNA repair exonuclease SbcCD ATPase subunit